MGVLDPFLNLQGWGNGRYCGGGQDQGPKGGLEDRARVDGGRHLRWEGGQSARYESTGNLPTPILQF